MYGQVEDGRTANVNKQHDLVNLGQRLVCSSLKMSKYVKSRLCNTALLEPDLSLQIKPMISTIWKGNKDGHQQVNPLTA